MTFIAIGISILISGIFGGCQALRPLFVQPAGDPNRPGLAQPPPAAVIIDTVAAVTPPPYKQILMMISAALTSGVFIDNRRKDTVIKVLKASNANQTKIITNTLNPQPPDPTG